ncbi:hypothetical protein METP3_02815 [Methanosarcinales archaeon]|nr:hypothetical protein METP3_02815 [Methanosarcinales archaeon]
MATNNLRQTANLLTAGIVAGPLFVVISLVQAFTREGFDIVQHPASLLSLGDLGWIQITNFVIAGVLYIAAAVGLSRSLREGIGRKWAPRLLALFGLSLIIGGVFTADPGLGFPPGAPKGPAEEFSWHGMIHAFAPVMGFIALAAALLILARRFWIRNERAWTWTTVLVTVAMITLNNIPNFTGDWKTGTFNFVPLWAGTAIGFCYVSIVMTKIRKELTKI